MPIFFLYLIGEKYFVTFIDNNMCLYLMFDKTDVFDIFKKFEIKIKR